MSTNKYRNFEDESFSEAAVPLDVPKLRKDNRRLGSLSVAELNECQLFWLRRSQIQDFSSEISSLTHGNEVNRRSCLKSLNPFLDCHNVIRVGGRLSYAPIPESQRCPIVLSSRNPIVKMLFQYEHIRLLYIGPQGLLAHIHRKYWPIRGRSLARQTVHKCMICFRFKPRMLQPVMAPLPSVRDTRCRAFERAGVDLYGPINIRSGLRKVTPLKHYIAVFVCMVTRAVIWSLFEICLRMRSFLCYSGAKKILSSWASDLSKESKLNDQLSELGIEWQFILPSAPHSGGLWESAVKSAKQHLVKSSNGSLLTYEETSTLLCRNEAVLNSRPLTATSSDPSDFNVLTPGHFLIGCPLTSPPEPNVLNLPENRLRKFQLIQARLQHFWKRWSAEYLPQLQRRDRWISKKSKDISVGDLAILKPDNIPSLQWQMVRVIKVCPGADGVVRVVTVRNATGTEYVRPVRKLARLPNQEEDLPNQKDGEDAEY
ncbi:uncharacterized protein LOC103307827 [Acyrthosiphon pisum]|uniref:DUF5641 domain-containing protein n=1 Tax=Acyrthosiphon pisum TaxID=7029 RepID=A0A8R1X0B6_ACYPI|nr:uncharacterized protein LOC103307827 [Acyrthosiphon pisum]|eukprot:XP_008178394.1 PREDICTED: uncharacterized protein LOC103307827 [Acyrthosiphon pisum]